jgi:hypothetical protein
MTQDPRSDSQKYWDRKWEREKLKLLPQDAEHYYLKDENKCSHCGFYLNDIPFKYCIKMMCLNITIEDPEPIIANENIGKRDPALLEAEYSMYLSEMGELGTKPLVFSKWLAKRDKEEAFRPCKEVKEKLLERSPDG